MATPHPDRQSYFIVYSHSSGRRRWKDDRHAIRAFFDARRIPHALVEFDRGKQEIGELPWESVARGEYTRVVAVGGDGLLRSLTEHLHHAGIPAPLGYVPHGSANLFAHAHGIPRDVGAALRHLVRAEPVAVPIGILDGKHVFLLAACFGRIAEITLQTKPALKRMLGFGAYVVAGARKVFHFPHEHLQLRSDDGERAVYAHSFLVFTPGFSRIALPTADATQRSLQSLVLTNRSPVGLAHTLWDLFVRRRRGKRMLHLTGPWFTVRSGMVRTVHLDGDEVELLADECRMEILPTNQLFLLSKTQN